MPEPTAEQVHQPFVGRSAELEAAESLANSKSRIVGRVLPMVEARELQRRRKQNVPADDPAPARFAVTVPSDLPELDLNAMKLAAMFTAKNGLSFEHGLLQREQRNPMFSFLEPRHSLHAVYRRLVASYEAVIMPPADVQKQLEALADWKGQLALALDRWVFEADQQQRRLEQAADDDKLQKYNAAVNWHEFVLVGEIAVDDDDVSELPPIMSIQLLRQMARLEAAGAVADAAADAAANAPNDDGDMDMDEEASADMDMSGDDVAPIDASIDPSKVRDSFVRTSATSRTTVRSAVAMQVCPRCGQDVPVNEMAEHMRIELLDPKYIEQRKRNEAKTKERSYADPSQVAANLARLASKRSEMAGGSTVNDAPRLAATKPLSAAAAAAAAAAATAANNNSNQFDSVLDDEPDLPPQQQRQQQAPPQKQQQQQQQQQQKPSKQLQPPQPPQQQQAPPLNLPPPGWMPPGMSLPPMPVGWMPGMPLPPLPGFPPTGGAAAGAGLLPTPSAPVQVPPPPPPPIASAFVAPISSDDGGVAKRARVDEQAPPPPPPPPVSAGDDDDEGGGAAAVMGQVSAIAWAKQVPVCTLHVEATADTSKAAAGWGLRGQTVTLSNVDINATVERVKELLSAQLGGMPAKKQKLMWTGRGVVLKDSQTLAQLNFASDEALVVSGKTRGGRRK